MTTVADFELVRPPLVVDGLGSEVAHPPGRLGLPPGRTVVVRRIRGGPADWPAAVRTLERIAAIRSRWLPALVEAAPLSEPGFSGYVVHDDPAATAVAEAGRPLPLPAAARAVGAAASGAHELHEAGQAHGAIGPATILVGAEVALLALPELGSPAEAGLVLAAGDRRRLELLDPERLRGEPPSRGSDIWALGATLHRLLSARPLYPGIDDDPVVTAVQRIVFTRPEPDPAIPLPALEVIRACLASDPGSRPRTAAEVAAALGGVGRP